jgi:MFS family permease
MAGQSVSLSGFWMQSVAQGWLVYSLSGSEFWLGAVAFVGYLPVLCLSPVAGAVVDRVDKYRLIVATQASAMVLALKLGALSWAHLVSVPVVALLAALLGTVGAFDLPARQAFLVDLVGPEDLPSRYAQESPSYSSRRP